MSELHDLVVRAHGGSTVCDGVEATEIEPWHQDGETWRRPAVRFPADITTHNTEQTFYFGADFLLHRHDYAGDVLGGFAAQAGPWSERGVGDHGTVGDYYTRLAFTHEATNGTRTYLEWEAAGPTGTPMNGVTVLTRAPDGRIEHVAIHHRPLDAALEFSRELGKRTVGVVAGTFAE
ncbi:MAG TPA: hypothetical protein VHF06_09420 [Pseudonocardiaceae bacterium]|jgi:hypothetical protein|nr:hypothetical protein [Pseudonocardiaceae bacterium]